MWLPPLIIELHTNWSQRNEWQKRECTCLNAHCSYLNIYISWKIRLCLVDLEGQVQVNFLTKPIISFIWKFKSIILIFALFFAGVVKSSAFCTLLMLFPRVEILELQFDAKMWLKWFNLLEIASTVCKKHWIWQLLHKIEQKWV